MPSDLRSFITPPPHPVGAEDATLKRLYTLRSAWETRPVTSAERLLFVSFVAAALFAVLTFVVATTRVPLGSAAVFRAIALLVVFVVAYLLLGVGGSLEG